jgi:mono/diheme cytochrome c family protein
VARILRRVVALGAVGFALLQLVPYGAWRFDNPPVVRAADFPTAQAEAVARAACFDCHSHETRYPPYAYVAPGSWLLWRDVEQGRAELNLSEWDDGDGDDAADAILDGTMPPRRYTLLHPEARLTVGEAELLATAFAQMRERD